MYMEVFNVVLLYDIVWCCFIINYVEMIGVNIQFCTKEQDLEFC